MKDKKQSLDSKAFNKELLLALKDNKMNFAQYFMAEENTKLSFVAKYNQQVISDKGGCSILNEDLSSEVIATDIPNFYYGISPKISASFLIDAISNLALSTKEGLQNLIKQNRELFTMHAAQKEYLYYFAESALISLTCLYGIQIEFNNPEVIKRIKNDIGMDDYFLETEKFSKILLIRGCPTRQLLTYFNDNNYKFQVYDGAIIASDDSSGEPLENIYKDKSNIKLLNASVFYSGVMLRALRFEKKTSANANIIPIIVDFERSTYATVYAFSHVDKTHSHPFISVKNNRKPIVDFLYDDDMFADNMLQEFESTNNQDECKFIDIVNRYLANTHSVAQIGVSGNLITSDEVLVLGKRSPIAIDANQYYPGVNGNAEIVDEDVEFYSDSVYEDYPCIKLGDTRKDFNGELSREAYAELGIALDPQQWKCDGIAIVGRVNKVLDKRDIAYNPCERRIHFNLICEQKCDYSFLNVVEKQITSTENYENTLVKGISYKCYKNIPDLLKKASLATLALVLNMKSMVTSLLSLVVFFILVKDTSFDGTVEKYVSSFFSILVCVSSAISAVKSLCKVIKKEKVIKHLHIIKHINDKDKIDGFLHNMFFSTKDTVQNQDSSSQKKEYKTEFHPTTYIAVKYYLEKILINT